jgi:hypothetical protein
MYLFLLPLGVIYALAFWFIALRKPAVVLALVFASAPIENDLSGGGPVKFSIAEINLLLLVPVFLYQRRRFGGGIVLAATIGYFLAGLGCTLLSWRVTSLVALVQEAMYLIIALTLFGAIPKTIEDYRPSLIGFIWASLIIATAAIIVRSGFVLGLHKNNAADSIAAGLLIALELVFHTKDTWRKRGLLLAVFILAVGLINTLSRGAWLAAITGTLVIFALRRQFGLMLRVTIVGGVLFAVCWNLLPQASRDYAAGLDGNLSNLKPRFVSKDFAMREFASSPVTGVGVGLRKEFDATNFVFLTLAETGVVGMVAFILMEGTIWVLMLRAQSRMSRDSFAFSLVVIACALGAGKLTHGMVDHYWVRGPLLSSWAALGMGTRAAYEERKRRRAVRRARLAAQLAESVESESENDVEGGEESELSLAGPFLVGSSNHSNTDVL